MTADLEIKSTSAVASDTSKAVVTGIISMVLGGALMVFASVLLNRIVKHDQVQTISDIVSFKIESVEKSKAASNKSAAPQKQSRQKATAKKMDVTASMAGALPGLDFGLGTATNGALANDLTRGLMSDQKDAVMSSDNVDVEPRAVRTTSPEYPQEARDKKLTGFVAMNLLINEQGHVEKVVVVDAQPKGVFDNAAMDSISSWQYEPARYQGKAVKVWAQQRIRFEAN